MEKLKELADKLYSSAQYLSTDASRLRKAMKDYHDFVTYEYPKVKKDLALTWEDIDWILTKGSSIFTFAQGTLEDCCNEVLRRFNAYKQESNESKK